MRFITAKNADSMCTRNALLKTLTICTELFVLSRTVKAKMTKTMTTVMKVTAAMIWNRISKMLADGLRWSMFA